MRRWTMNKTRYEHLKVLKSRMFCIFNRKNVADFLSSDLFMVVRLKSPSRPKTFLSNWTHTTRAAKNVAKQVLVAQCQVVLKWTLRDGVVHRVAEDVAVVSLQCHKAHRWWVITHPNSPAVIPSQCPWHMSIQLFLTCLRVVPIRTIDTRTNVTATIVRTVRETEIVTIETVTATEIVTVIVIATENVVHVKEIAALASDHARTVENAISTNPRDTDAREIMLSSLFVNKTLNSTQ